MACLRVLPRRNNKYVSPTNSEHFIWNHLITNQSAILQKECIAIQDCTDGFKSWCAARLLFDVSFYLKRVLNTMIDV